MRYFLRNNGLSLALSALFLLCFLGQFLAGLHKSNGDREEHGRVPFSWTQYAVSSEFLEATAENWESEFLQLFTFVLLTRFLYQKGSAESLDPDAPEEESPLPPMENMPRPARKGGLFLKLYEHSLSITFFLLFLLSGALHAVGGVGEYNEEQLEHGQKTVSSAWSYLWTSSFWFQSLQNWQSEFLALFSMVFLSIWLREKKSPESKEVSAPHDKTGK